MSRLSHQSQPDRGPTAAGTEQAPADVLFGLITGYEISNAIYAATSLGIPELLAQRPCDHDEVAAHAGADPDSVQRLLRLLTAAGVLEQRPDGRFQLSDLGEYLRRDVPHSMAAVALHFAGPFQMRAWMDLETTVRTGKPALLEKLKTHSAGPGGPGGPGGAGAAGGAPFGGPGGGAHGKPFFGEPPAELKTFSEAMSFMGGQVGEALAAGAYDFTTISTLVDVGGSLGALLAGILERYPHLRGIVFEVPAVAEQAREHLAEIGLAERCEVVGGDFFSDPVPARADAYLLKSVIHDFDDERVVALLRNVRRAMGPHSRLLVAEPVLAERTVASTAALRVAGSDVNMMVLLGSRERTEADYQRLLGAAGFSISSVTLIDNMPSGMSGSHHLIEATPQLD